MIIDEFTSFAQSRRLELSPLGTSIFGHVIDLGPEVSLGSLDGLFLRLRVATSAAASGAATARFHLVSDSAAAILTDGTASHHFGTKAFSVANMTAGTNLLTTKLPAGPFERYLGLLIEVSTDVFTAGAVDAFLTLVPSDWEAW